MSPFLGSNAGDFDGKSDIRSLGRRTRPLTKRNVKMLLTQLEVLDGKSWVRLHRLEAYAPVRFAITTLQTSTPIDLPIVDGLPLAFNENDRTRDRPVSPLALEHRLPACDHRAKSHNISGDIFAPRQAGKLNRNNPHALSPDCIRIRG